jgi:hypothetical protein
MPKTNPVATQNMPPPCRDKNAFMRQLYQLIQDAKRLNFSDDLVQQMNASSLCHMLFSEISR